MKIPGEKGGEVVDVGGWGERGFEGKEGRWGEKKEHVCGGVEYGIDVSDFVRLYGICRTSG